MTCCNMAKENDGEDNRMLLSEMNKRKDYLVCIDSDGCLLDNMELKHKECFCPAVVNVWDLQSVSRYAREVWEFVNLYSRTRGANRFPALVRALELIYARPEVQERHIRQWDIAALKKWSEETDNFSESALASFIERQGDDAAPDLQNALRWSREVNSNVRHIVRNIGPFPGVQETLAALHEHADVVVVSSTPQEALIRELDHCGILNGFDAVAGQESGTKAICIRTAMQKGYEPDHVLKVGDAPGDHQAALDNGCLFYPIIPGLERESWRRLREEAAGQFIAGTYQGEPMAKRLEQFYTVLGDKPGWEA